MQVVWALPETLYDILPEEEKQGFRQMCSNIQRGGDVAAVSGV
jgi:hypothetical protein